MGNEVRVGAFVLFASLVLAAGTLWILGHAPWRGGFSELQVRMTHSGGVRAGDAVRVAGVNAGRVEALELRPGNQHPVELLVSLDDSIALHEGAFARLASDGLLGTRYLEIEPGRSDRPPLDRAQGLVGEATPTFDQVLVQLGGLAGTAGEAMETAEATLVGMEQNLDSLLGRLEDLLSEENVDQVGELISEARTLVSDLGPRLDELVGRTDGLVAELTSAGERLAPMADELQGLAADVRTSLGPEGERLVKTLDSARLAMESFNLSSGDMRATVEDLEATLQNLRELTRTLRDRPDSLIGLRPAPKDRRPGDPPRRTKGNG